MLAVGPAGAMLPTGLAYMASGVGFCFMTQISRDIEHKKVRVDGLRLSQVWDNPADPKDGSRRIAAHLFLNSTDSEVRCEEQMQIAARICTCTSRCKLHCSRTSRSVT